MQTYVFWQRPIKLIFQNNSENHPMDIFYVILENHPIICYKIIIVTTLKHKMSDNN